MSGLLDKQHFTAADAELEASFIIHEFRRSYCGKQNQSLYSYIRVYLHHTYICTYTPAQKDSYTILSQVNHNNKFYLHF